jgi:multisubunit Na+/H+ antiporter MnhG subunit
MRSPKPFTVYQPVPAKARSRSSPFTPIRSIRRGLEREAMEVAVDGLIGANIVSVSIVATAAVRSSANGSRAYRCRSHTVAPIAVAAITAPIAVAPIACAAHRNSAAASRSSNCDRTAAVTAATPIGTSAASSLGIIGDQAGDEQNESGERSENIAEHNGTLP